MLAPVTTTAPVLVLVISPNTSVFPKLSPTEPLLVRPPLNRRMASRAVIEPDAVLVTAAPAEKVALIRLIWLVLVRSPLNCTVALVALMAPALVLAVPRKEIISPFTALTWPVAVLFRVALTRPVPAINALFTTVEPSSNAAIAPSCICPLLVVLAAENDPPVRWIRPLASTVVLLVMAKCLPGVR